MIQLREMKLTEWIKMLKITNQRRVARWTRQRSLFSLRQYWEDFLSKKYAIIKEGKMVGGIRIFENEISIAIDESYQDKGIGSEALKLICKKEMYLLAKIAKDNLKSSRVFEKNGFKFIGLDKNLKVYEFKA